MFKLILLQSLFIIVFLNSCKTKNYHIHKIEFRALGCYGTCPIFDLTINENKSAVYVSKSSDITSMHFGDTIGVFKGTINDNEFKKIITLLNSSDFPTLKNDYQASVTDGASCALKIIYDNELIKNIFDEGQDGTRQLKQLYNVFWELRENQKWK